MRKTSRAEKICTVCEKIGDIGDSVKGSSSRMKNKVGAQKGAFIKMKRENMYVYQWLCGVCYVPIIIQILPRSTEINSKPVYCAFWPVSYLLLSTGLNRNQVTVGGTSGGILCSVQGYAPNEAKMPDRLMSLNPERKPASWQTELVCILKSFPLVLDTGG